MKKTTKKSKKPVKRNRRTEDTYPALKPKLNLKTRTELIDYDYLDKLSPDEKKWLNKFTEEYTNANLDYKNLSNNLHNTKELKKDCTDRNNSRNRDILTRAKASGNAYYLEDLKNNPEYRKQINEHYAKILEDVGSNLEDSDNNSDDDGNESN